MRLEPFETFQCLFCTHYFVLTAAEIKYSNGFQLAMGRFGFGVLSWRNKQCSVSKPKYQLDQIFIELVSVELDSQYNKFGSQQRHIVLTEAMLPVRK